jgi:hypothetical protein
MTRAFLPPLSHNLEQYLDAIHLRRAVRRGADSWSSRTKPIGWAVAANPNSGALVGE